MASVEKLDAPQKALNINLDPITFGSSHLGLSDAVEGSAANPSGFCNGLAMEGERRVGFPESATASTAGGSPLLCIPTGNFLIPI
jgi:hypothetical protein